MRLTAAALLGLLGLALGAEITLYLPAKPNPFSLSPTTRATLTALHAHHAAPLTAVNTFAFRNVTAGSYLVDVHCPTDAFRPLRLDVGADGGVLAWETFRGNEWANRGEALPVKEGSAGRGVELRAIGGKNYYTERPKFSVLSILANPMILMGLASMAIFIGMPYMMENMDPEMKAEFDARQKDNPMNAVMGGGGQPGGLGNFDMAAYLAGSGKKDSGSGGGGGGGGGGGSSKNQGGGVKR